MSDEAVAFRGLLKVQCGVVTRTQIPAGQWERVRWLLESHRWQRICPGLFVHQPGPLSAEQRRWVGVLGGGEGAALCGPTAAEMAGLEGFETNAVHVRIPARRHGCKIAGVRYHRKRSGPTDLAANRQPPRVALAHALIEMAATALTDDRAHQILTASVQQGLLRPQALEDAVAAKGRLRRRSVIAETLLDISDGAQSLNELAMLAIVRTHGLPMPQLQMQLATDRRRSRIDGGWPQYAVCFEIDGAGHFAIGKWIDDADRQNEVALATPEGTTLLRWPGFTVRQQPAVVADQAARALARGGWPG